MELACFRIAQEALTNALRHADAQRVSVTLSATGDRIELRIEDDGSGFDAGRTHGLGLVTMRERAQQLGGRFEVEAGADGGTRVSASLPMREAADSVATPLL
ncbi:ATP-binding protein [Novilysobacter erysipheiresistens]|uniref:ATP-binding protein n=1 Tax=Novilysobacter erysipheiresistens TaxID=1749332 RepID=UPI003CE53654